MATVDPSQVEFGQSIPPHGPHTITIHAPRWETAMKFRDGDMSVIMKLKSMYPRFSPFGVSAAFCQAIGQKLSLPAGHTLAAFLAPDVWSANASHAVSKFRKQHALAAADLSYHVVEVAGIRLYAVSFPMTKMMGAIFEWQHGGLGFSTRMAEALMPSVQGGDDGCAVLGSFPEGRGAPEPTYLPECEAHGRLRERIAGYMNRATAVEHPKKVGAGDVFLYQTGMAAIHRFHDVVAALRDGPTVVFGAVFHSTWHLFEESTGGIKHYPSCSDAEVDEFEKYLEGGGKCGYVFTEFPSNPILVCVDLMRLRQLADKYGFFIAVDDTVAAFSNIDILPATDVVITSLTKSFSGYADMMAGSVVLNPNSPSYSTLKATVASSFHNEFFSADAEHLLRNSDDFLPRTAVMNRNAAALTDYFASLVDDPSTPVTRVWYPPHSPGLKYLQAFMRKPTPELPEPGYGCLFSVDFATLDDTIAYYDNLNLFHGPHLGAHLSLALPYSAVTYGKANPEYHAAYGLVPNQLRFAVGLEDTQVLLERCKAAVARMMEAGKERQSGDEVARKVQEKVDKDGDAKIGFDPLAGTGV
ncbi:cystathionine gamma-synthase [Xylariaceae sp. FL0016]|nr:cystathionine gamma-synthase [Xylariaceae sp. FL0016]